MPAAGLATVNWYREHRNREDNGRRARLVRRVAPGSGGSTDVCDTTLCLIGVSRLPIYFAAGTSRFGRNDLLSLMACHNAVRAGDRLSPEQVAALVAQRQLAQDAHHCPHGWPTSLLFSHHDLKRQFRRT